MPRSRRCCKPSAPRRLEREGPGRRQGERLPLRGLRQALYPVIDTTSARLILGTDGDFDVNFVPDDEIAKQKQGDTIGIPGAPDLLPTPAKLIQTGWVACTGAGEGIAIGLSSRKSVTPRPDDGVRGHHGG